MAYALTLEPIYSQAANEWAKIDCFSLLAYAGDSYLNFVSQLMELADCIEEVRTTCHFCNKKAVFNLKHVNGVADTTGPGLYRTQFK